MQEVRGARGEMQGTPEAGSGGQDIVVSCQERRTVKQKLLLQLPGLQDWQPGDLFTQQLVLPPGKAAALLHAVSVEPAQASLPDLAAPLEFYLSFAPRKVRRRSPLLVHVCGPITPYVTPANARIVYVCVHARV